jgi:threonine aldolase
MCNEIALRVHCRPGDEMIAHRTAHPIHFEAGGPAALAGVNVHALDGPRGQYDEAAVAAAIRPDSRYMPKSRLLWVEQTSNLGGGSIWPLTRIAAVTDVARRRDMRTHLDGARLMNAVVTSGIAAREYLAPLTRCGSTSQGARRPGRRRDRRLPGVHSGGVAPQTTDGWGNATSGGSLPPAEYSRCVGM